MPLDAADLAEFVSEDMPGYVEATVGGVSVDGIFDNGYGSALDVAGSTPSLLLPSSSAASATRGTAVVVGGVSYTVSSVEPDGTGMTLLRLQEV